MTTKDASYSPKIALVKCLFIPYYYLLIIMLQLRAECVESLQNFIKTRNSNKDEIVTCIFDTNIQFEQLDEAKLLPKDVMRIVYDYFDDKIIVDCNYSSDIDGNGEFVLFNISNSDTKIMYHYYFFCNLLIVREKNFNQKDGSIVIISSSLNYFNLSRLYYHYAQNDNSTFELIGCNSVATIDNDKYTIRYRNITYVLLVLDHEILKQRINVMKQLIDIIKN